jgi:hypothetical protein
MSLYFSDSVGPMVTHDAILIAKDAKRYFFITHSVFSFLLISDNAKDYARFFRARSGLTILAEGRNSQRKNLAKPGAR